MIDTALAEVRQQYLEKGKVDRFDALCPLVAPAAEPPSHAEVARGLGCSVGSVKIAAHRLRQQFGAALRAEVGRTVDPGVDPSGDQTIHDELQLLLSALRGE